MENNFLTRFNNTRNKNVKSKFGRTPADLQGGKAKLDNSNVHHGLLCQSTVVSIATTPSQFSSGNDPRRSWYGMTTASLGICGNTRLGHVYEDSLRDILCGGSRTLVNRKRGREKWLVYTDYLIDSKKIRSLTLLCKISIFSEEYWLIDLFLTSFLLQERRANCKVANITV